MEWLRQLPFLCVINKWKHPKINNNILIHYDMQDSWEEFDADGELKLWFHIFGYTIIPVIKLKSDDNKNNETKASSVA